MEFPRVPSGLVASPGATDSLRASSITIAVQLLRFGVNLAASMLLARLLRPEDFGVYGMAMTAVGLLLLFRDGGVESAILHRGQTTDAELAALASLNALYGLGLAAICALLGPMLAWFYAEPRLEAAALLASVCFIGYGLDVQPGALLLREHRFKSYAWVDFGALVLGLLVALALAARGAGYWSLFGMDVAVCAGTLAGHWRAARWQPRFRGGWRSVAGFVTFGRNVSIIRALGHIAGNIDNVMIGLMLGPAALAFYAKAFRLINLPLEGINWPLTRVAVPTLSRLRDRPTAYAAAFRRFNLISVGLGMPWVLYFVCSADNVVRVVYGEQWAVSVPLVRLLGVMGFCNTFLLGPAWVYVSTGTVHRQVRWEIVNVLFLAAAFAVGLRWGLAGVAAAASISYAAIRAPALIYCFRGTPLKMRDLGAVLWRPTFASVIATIAILGEQKVVGTSDSPLIALTLDAVSLAAGYITGWMAVPGWRRFLKRELHAAELEASAINPSENAP